MVGVGWAGVLCGLALSHAVLVDLQGRVPLVGLGQTGSVFVVGLICSGGRVPVVGLGQTGSVFVVGMVVLLNAALVGTSGCVRFSFSGVVA